MQRANPITRALRKADREGEAKRRRAIKRELWHWRRRVGRDTSSAGWLQRQPIANRVRELVRSAWDALRAGEPCDLQLEQLRSLKAQADYLDLADAPETRRGAQFSPGSKPGRRGPLKRWLHEYLDRHPDADIREVWFALCHDPQSAESGTAGCITFAGKQQSRENVRKKLSEARQER